MPTLRKKWLLVMLFCTLSSLATQHPESAIAGSNRSEIATKKPSGFKASLRGIWDTVKSDLSIGNKVVQHETVSSQVAAAGRLCGYHLVIAVPMILLHFKLNPPQANDKASMAALVNAPIGALALFTLYASTLAPILEETLFTSIPKVIGDKLPLKVHNAILLAVATTFGCAHTHKSAPLMIAASCFNYGNGRYLLGRNPTDAAPIYAHMLWNSFNFSLLLGLVACAKYKMNTQAAF